MPKKDFLEEKYCEINKLKTLLQVYPKEYCSTIIKVMNNVFDEITEYLKEKPKEYIKLDKVGEVKNIFKKDSEKSSCTEVMESIDNTTKCEEKSTSHEEYKCEKEKKHENHKHKRGEENSRNEIFTLDELSKFNGKNGQPAYVAINGTVYNVSAIAQWKTGEHYGLFAGKDLSEYINVCHQDNSILDNAVVVGKLVDNTARQDQEITFTAKELEKYNGVNEKAYVAINGIVYDVTEVGEWKYGRHYGLIAGKDLSQYFNSCHKNDMKRLEKLKVVGRFIEEG